jgi:hypothetical protein
MATQCLYNRAPLGWVGVSGGGPSVLRISTTETVVSKWEDYLPYLFVDSNFEGSSSERHFLCFVHELESCIAQTGCIISGYPVKTSVVRDLFTFKIYTEFDGMYSLGIRGEIFKGTQSNKPVDRPIFVSNICIIPYSFRAYLYGCQARVTLF